MLDDIVMLGNLLFDAEIILIPLMGGAIFAIGLWGATWLNNYLNRTEHLNA